MQLTIKNQSPVPLPVSGDDGGAWAATLEPDTPLTIDHAGTWLIGDKAGASTTVLLTIANDGTLPVQLVSNGGSVFALAPATSTPYIAAQFVELQEGNP